MGGDREEPWCASAPRGWATYNDHRAAVAARAESGFDFGGLSLEQRAQTVVEYNEQQYGFVSMASKALSELCPDLVECHAAGATAVPLERLHEAAGCVVPSTANQRSARANPYAHRLQLRLPQAPAFRRALHAFVRREVCAALHIDRAAYQAKPTFRVHLSGAPAQGLPHADGLEPYNRAPAEVNVWVPLTRVSGGNSLHAESEPGAGDFRAFEARPGQFVRFYGNGCWHYTVANDTGRTRVSFDIRVVPFHLLSEDQTANEDEGSHRRSGAGGAPFRLGEYYRDSADEQECADEEEGDDGVDDVDEGVDVGFTLFDD